MSRLVFDRAARLRRALLASTSALAPGHIRGFARGSVGHLQRESAPRHARGFTLVELMVTLVIAVVLIMIAVPNFRSLTISNKLTTAANDTVIAINVARMEAIKRNASAQLCSNAAAVNTSDTLGTACNTPTLQTGAVYALANGTATPVRGEVVGITAPLALTGDMAAVRFDGRGIGHAPATPNTPFAGVLVDISTDAISSNNHRCINMTAGSIVVVTSSSGACT